jgi:hypothetical protein
MVPLKNFGGGFPNFMISSSAMDKEQSWIHYFAPVFYARNDRRMIRDVLLRYSLK